MVNGWVKWFDEGKGLGFIQLASGGPDIFVHYSNIVMEGHRVLHPGDRVEFDLLDGPKGPLAQNIQLVWRNAFPKPRWYYQRFTRPRRRFFPFPETEDEDGAAPAEAEFEAAAELAEE
ncbi:MAG: cold shock domain-containing protein [Pseudomonadota bacterium]